MPHNCAMTDIESPCIGVCALNAEAVCTGCGRSIDEIAEWSQAGSTRRDAVIAAARVRLTRLKQPQSTAAPE